MERRALIKLGLANLAVACSPAVSAGVDDGGTTADTPPAAVDAPPAAVDAGTPVSPTSFGVGRAVDHPAGVWKLFAARRVIVARDDGGFFAFSAACTHQNTTIGFRAATACEGPTGCTSMSRTGLTECPNHFSRFDANGGLVRGPASSPLRHFQVALVDGEIRVDPAEVVDADERTPLSLR